MWNTKEMSQMDTALTGVPLTLTFDLEVSTSNCISGMGGPIVMERKGWESKGCRDVKDNHYVSSRQRKLLGTAGRGDLRCRRFRLLILVWYIVCGMLVIIVGLNMTKDWTIKSFLDFAACVYLQLNKPLSTQPIFGISFRVHISTTEGPQRLVDTIYQGPIVDFCRDNHIT